MLVWNANKYNKSYFYACINNTYLAFNWVSYTKLYYNNSDVASNVICFHLPTSDHLSIIYSYDLHFEANYIRRPINWHMPGEAIVVQSHLKNDYNNTNNNNHHIQHHINTHEHRTSAQKLSLKMCNSIMFYVYTMYTIHIYRYEIQTMNPIRYV